MTPGRGRKRCTRRLFPPPLCVPMPRPCLESLQIPTLQPCALCQTTRTEFVPRCVQPSCGIKRRTCHCADQNYCTSETCTNAASCMQSQNRLSPDGFKGGKDEDSVCNGPCRLQEARERDYVENYETVETACNEAACEQLENCGVGAISNNEELIDPVTYSPSVTNQGSLSRTPPIVPSKQVPFNNDSAQKNNHLDDPSLQIVDFTGRETNQKSINFDEANRLSNINRSIQINMQNETVSGRRRDEESSVAPEVCFSGNEVPNSSSLSETSQSKLYNEDKINGPVENIKTTFDPEIEKYDTNAQTYSQSSKIIKSHLNNHISNVEDNSDYFKDNLISQTDENNPNKTDLNSCCTHSYHHPASFEHKFQEQLSDSENGEFGNDYQRTEKTIEQNVKRFSEQYENHAEINYINGTSMQSTPQRLPGTNIDSLHIRDNNENILPEENVLPNSISSSTKTTSNVNASTSNELAKMSLSSNNSTNQRRLFYEGKTQFMSNAPNECCKSGTPPGHLGTSDSTSQKPNSIPSSTNTTSNVNASTSNELAKMSLSSNNSTNQRRLFYEGKTQFMSNAPNECCKSGTPPGHLGTSDSTSQKPNSIPSSTNTTSNVNASTSNELAKMSLSSNNSTNQRRLFYEDKTQFVSSAPNECCKSETPPGYLGTSDSTSQKPPQFMSPSPSTNIQHIKPYTKPPLTDNTSQVRFNDKNHISNATYPSPIENQNLKLNAPSRSSDMGRNNYSSKKINHKIQPTNSATSDQRADIVCENFKPGCCSHVVRETAKKRELPSYKPAPHLGCICPDELESWTEPKHNQKNEQKFASNDLNGKRCEKKPACLIEDGTTSCISTTCVVNRNLGCVCRYPPAFKQFSCTGNISGICNCKEQN